MVRQTPSWARLSPTAASASTRLARNQASVKPPRGSSRSTWPISSTMPVNIKSSRGGR
jgi:hypothetical protein